MTPIRKLYSPDPFDDLIKAKLNEVEVDASLADKYWQPVDDRSLQEPSRKMSFLYWIGAFVLIMVLLFLIKMITHAPADVTTHETNKIQVQQNNSSPLKEQSAIQKTESAKHTVLIKHQKQLTKVNASTDLSISNLPVHDSASFIVKPAVAPLDSIVKTEIFQNKPMQLIDSVKRLDSVNNRPQQQTKKRKSSYIIW